MSLRILHVIPSLSLVHGGPSRALRSMARALQERDIQVETATTDDDGPGRHLDPRSLDSGQAEGGIVHYFPKTFDRYKVSIPLARWLLRNVGRFDVVHIHALFSFASTVAAWAARRAGVPYVIRPLGTLSTYGLTRRRPLAKRLSLALVEKRILMHAAAVHFTADVEREEAGALRIPMRPVVIPLAVEPPPPPDPEALFAFLPQLHGHDWVLYLSRLDRKKNVEGLLHAISLCAQASQGVRWLIAGDGDAEYVASLHALSQELGLQERVVWAGQLEGGQKSAAFAQALFFVLPSFSENFGIAAAEALVAGLPVVLGKGVALSGLASDSGAGLAVEPAPEAIAIALRYYLLDPDARYRAAELARALGLRAFSLQSMGSRLADLYGSIRSDAGSVAAIQDHA